MPNPEDHREISEKTGIRVSDKIEYQRQTGVFHGHVPMGTELQKTEAIFSQKEPHPTRGRWGFFLSESPIGNELLEFDSSTSFFDFAFDFLGFFFGDAFFQCRRNALDHFLGFHQ